MLSAEEKAAAKGSFKDVAARFDGKLGLLCNGCGDTGRYLSTKPSLLLCIRKHNTQSDFEASIAVSKCFLCKRNTGFLVVDPSDATSWTKFYNKARLALKAEVDHETALKEHATRSIFGLVCLKPSPAYTYALPAERVIKPFITLRSGTVLHDRCRTIN